MNGAVPPAYCRRPAQVGDRLAGSCKECGHPIGIHERTDSDLGTCAACAAWATVDHLRALIP